MTNGLANLQVYTGGAPASEGRAMSGYINEVINRGKYPGGGDFTGVMGSPVFNHTINADIYGGTPDDRFTYYVSTLATNAYYNFGDRSNLANFSYTVPANDPGCGAFNEGPTVGGTTGATPLNCSVANGLNTPVSLGAYGSNPFASQRDTVTNLHWALQHNGLSDDLQALYVVGSAWEAPYGMYGTPMADPTQASLNYTVNAPGIAPGGRLTWPVGEFYRGSVGQPYNPALLEQLTWPSSGNSVGGLIPLTFNDSQSQQYSITKLGYTRALNQNSFLRIFGYSLFSYWTLDQPINGFIGATFYQLHDNATGVTMNYQNQLSQSNLLKFSADWSRDITLRYNYAPSFAAPACLTAPATTGPCAPGLPVTHVANPFATWSSTIPLDWDGVLSDTWRPSDKVNVDLGIRYDIFGYQLMPGMAVNGPNGLAVQAEMQDGVCLNGFNYSPTDPMNIGPNGNKNCFQLLTAAGGKDAPGAFNWQDPPNLLSFRTISPRFGFTYTANPRDVIRFSVGRYVQPPNSAFQEYRRAPIWGPGATVGLLNGFYDGLGFGVVHNIQPEDSTNYDLSWEHEFAGGVSMKLTPYYRNTRNQVLSIPFNPQSPSFVTGDNFGTARIKGVEFLLQKVVTGDTGIGGTLGVTFTDSKIRFQKVNGSSFIDLQNGRNPDGSCAGNGICGYNATWGTHYAELDPNGYYSPSFVQAPTSTQPSYDVPVVVNLTLDARTNGFDILPTLNYQSGNPYGDPLNFPDAHCAPAPAAPLPGCIPNPGNLAKVANGPDPYTNTFDAPGSLKGPSWMSLNLAVSHDIGKNVKASILAANLWQNIHNHGYAWEYPNNSGVISYADNGFYNSAPLGAFAGVAPNPPNAYYGSNYYPYAPFGILPLRTYVFSVSTKI